jgi:hypothetical protein
LYGSTTVTENTLEAIGWRSCRARVFPIGGELIGGGKVLDGEF